MTPSGPNPPGGADGSKRLRQNKAFETSVGGAFDKIGGIERDILLKEGLTENGFLVDIGCGAGRLAAQLREHPKLRYLGIDVVPELLDFAREQSSRAG